MSRSRLFRSRLAAPLAAVAALAAVGLGAPAAAGTAATSCRVAWGSLPQRVTTAAPGPAGRLRPHGPHLRRHGQRAPGLAGAVRRRCCCPSRPRAAAPCRSASRCRWPEHLGRGPEHHDLQDRGARQRQAGAAAVLHGPVGQTQVLLGLERRAPFRVFALCAPTRLVVDVRTR